MNKRPLSPVEKFGIIFIILVAVVGAWYLFFYQPIQKEMATIKDQISAEEANVGVLTAKLSKMSGMQKELDDIFAENPNPSQVAPFDNIQTVMNELYDILAGTTEYSLNFNTPTPDENGCVRRAVGLTFKANSYEEAKAIVLRLEQNDFRCLVTDLSVSGNKDAEGGIIGGEVDVTASLVFFESTNISK